MRLLSFTMLFRIVMSATLPFGSVNRLSLHVMGLSPNSRTHHSPLLSPSPSSPADTAATNSYAYFKAPDISKEACASPPSAELTKLPSLASVFSCRGGHSVDEAALKASSAVPISIFGVELSLFGLKLLLQAGLTLLNVACWWLPMQTKSFSQNENLMALANSFSAGIFLMLAFTHLVPHSLHTLEAANSKPVLALQATVVGYLVMLTVEKLLFNTQFSAAHAVEQSSPPSQTRVDVVVREKKDEERDRYRDSGIYDSGGVITRPRASSAASQQSAVVLLLAMALHSLFETVALGMAPDRTSAVLLATSVALHQPAESLALLVAFLKTSMEKKVIIRWLGLFSVVGPLGVFLGRYIQALASPLVEGLLVAMTAGTFLYVAASEILPETFEEAVPFAEKWKRFAALVGGIGSIMLLGSDDHDH